MKTETFLGRLAGAALSFCLAGAGLAQAADMTEVRFGVDPYTTGSQIWVARDQGYFEEEGIDATVTTFATGVEAIDSLIVGRADMAVGLDFPTVSRARGGQLVVLAGIFRSLPGWHKFVVANEIKEPADLVGGKLGIASGTAQHLVSIKYLENNGVDPDSVELVGFSSLVEIVASIKTGRIDGAFVWADGTEKSIEDGDHYVLTDDSAAQLSSSAYVSSSASFVEEHPEALVSVLKALAKASTFIADHPDEAATIIAGNTRAPADAVRKLLDFNTFQLALTDYERTGFTAISDFVAQSMGADVSFDTVVAPQFLTEAMPSAVDLGQ
ncbi:ABC transporter substrate-binding protein [Pseudooceanicola algae]|uniref:Aliphatic sulfonates-binding protein n=1 Tax=Pseudooceanicola algae TaxID=1537215 RepID=A0A418SL87_9RHOB|nr:ABC transporter substrate-binding protein [Pseudooceanicola algae]QPM90872.1 Putative aliphatic sulfonates-binding protein [Pseudooceanicola algae]